MFNIGAHHKLAQGLQKFAADRMIRDSQREQDAIYTHNCMMDREARAMNLYVRGEAEPTYALRVNGADTRYMFSAEARDECMEMMERVTGRDSAGTQTGKRTLDTTWEIVEIDHSAIRNPPEQHPILQLLGRLNIS